MDLWSELEFRNLGFEVVWVWVVGEFVMGRDRVRQIDLQESCQYGSCEEDPCISKHSIHSA